MNPEAHLKKNGPRRNYGKNIPNWFWVKPGIKGSSAIELNRSAPQPLAGIRSSLGGATIDTQVQSDLLLGLDVLWIADDDLRSSTIFGNLPHHTDLLIAVIFLSGYEFLAILSPNQDREDLARVRLVQV